MSTKNQLSIEKTILNYVDKRNEILQEAINSAEGDVIETLKNASNFLLKKQIWLVEKSFYIFENNQWNEIHNTLDKLENYFLKDLTMFYANLKLNKRKEINREILTLLQNEEICPKLKFPANIIFFQNGYFDLFEGKFFPISENIINLVPLVKLDFFWDDNVKFRNQTMIKLFHWFSRGKEENRILLTQIIGTLISGVQVEKIFNFSGSQASGKSLLISLLEDIISPKYVLQTQIASLNERFGTIQLLRKKLVIETDISTVQELDPFMLKKITGGDSIAFEIKGGGFFNEKVNTNILITSNTTLKFKGSFEGLQRRLLVYKFPYSIKGFDKELLEVDFEPVPLKELNKVRYFSPIDDHWHFKKEVLTPLVMICLKKFSEVINNDYEYLETDENKQEKENIEKDSNPVVYWFIDEFDVESNFLKDEKKCIYFQKSSFLYSKYSEWCTSSGYFKKGRNMFLKDLKWCFEKYKNQKVSVGEVVDGKRYFVVNYKKNLVNVEKS